MRDDLLQTKFETSMHQCPNCSKNALIQLDIDKYRCLWCGFSRDFSVQTTGSFEGVLAVLSTVGLIMLLL